VPNSKQRREAARRHLERQSARRQQQEARRKQFTLLATIIGTVVVLGVVLTTVVMLTHDNKKSTATAGASPSTTPSPTASASTTTSKVPGQCAYTAGGAAAKKVSLPSVKVPTTGIVTATVATTQGTLTFTMDRAKAPCTVASFASLAGQKYYDSTPCHRLTTSGIYVLQCGDPTGMGTGGPGYTIPDEYTGSEKYTAGVLAMANTGQPNTGGSQFFIVYKDTNLPAAYTVFGTVTKGLDVVTKVAAAGASGTKGDGAPKLAISLTSVTVKG
jgi:peptidyl-prolyl cis-trans isomerase B (cyclophilin B)